MRKRKKGDGIRERVVVHDLICIYSKPCLAIYVKDHVTLRVWGVSYLLVSLYMTSRVQGTIPLIHQLLLLPSLVGMCTHTRRTTFIIIEAKFVIKNLFVMNFGSLNRASHLLHDDEPGFCVIEVILSTTKNFCHFHFPPVIKRKSSPFSSQIVELCPCGVGHPGSWYDYATSEVTWIEPCRWCHVANDRPHCQLM